jgi:uncharacterized membrane protein
MKSIIGILLILVGICLGLYVGVYLCFIGGIVDIIEQVRAPEMDSTAVAWDVVRIMFAGLAGWACAVIFILPGKLLTDE